MVAGASVVKKNTNAFKSTQPITDCSRPWGQTNQSLPISMFNKHLSPPFRRVLGLLPVLLFCQIALLAQTRYTISGTITDRGSGEHLIGATVRDIKSGKGTVILRARGGKIAP